MRGSERLDLILLDLFMPDADGYSGIATVHVERPEVPIIVVSAMNAAQAATSAVRFGAANYLSKTADLDTIARTITDTLAGDRMAVPTDQ